MSMQNTSLKKMNPKIQFQKSKTKKLLLTDFNKFSLFNYSLKQSKKKLNITNQTNTNNSLKNQKNINTSNNNNIKNNHINNISYNNNNDFTLKNQKKISSTSKNELKQILYNNNNNNNSNYNNNNNNNSCNNNKSIKYNSVNNLIGINISVNYLNKNYTLNKMKQPNFCTSIYNNYSSKNLKNSQNQKKISNINDNYYNKYISESFNEINKGNNSYFNSSGKNRINKKKKFIMNPTQNDFQNIIDNLKYKSINKNNNNSVNKIQNQNEIKNTISSTDENNINNNNNMIYFNSPHKIVGIGKSLSCKHINNNNNNSNINDSTYHNHRYKNPGNKNIFKVLMNFLDKKISKLKDNIINNNKNNKEYTDDDKLYDIINEFFIKYCNALDDQFQKELIINIFYLINNIINRRDKQILILKKEKENIIEKNNLYAQNNEELMEQNNALMSKCNIMQNKIEELKSELSIYKKDFINKKKENNLNLDIKLNNNNISSDNNEENSQNASSSSYVNTEELESIRFFDKIEMKKHSFLNIPELSFQKIKLDELNKDKKPIKKKNSFQTKNPYIKKTKNNMDNLKRINKKIVYCNNSNILPKYKQKLHMNHKPNINLSGNKINSINQNNKPNNIGYLFVPDYKKGVEIKKAK